MIFLLWRTFHTPTKQRILPCRLLTSAIKKRIDTVLFDCALCERAQRKIINVTCRAIWSRAPSSETCLIKSYLKPRASDSLILFARARVISARVLCVTHIASAWPLTWLNRGAGADAKFNSADRRPAGPEKRWSPPGCISTFRSSPK